MAAAALGAMGGAMIGGIMNSAQNYETYWYNKELASEARAENYKYNEMAADNADKRQRAQFADLYSIPAQMQQLKDAGLSPSLMYGGTPSPGGMATGQQGGGANGIPAATYMPNSNVTAAAQLANSVASANLMDAQAKKTNAETEVIKPEAEANIEQKLADAGLKHAQKTYTESQTTEVNIRNMFAESEHELNMEKVNAEINKLYEEKEYIFWQGYHEMINTQFDIDTADVRKDTIIQNYSNMQADYLLKTAERKLTLTEEEKVRTEINAINEEITIKYIHEGINLLSQQAQAKWYKDQISQMEKQRTWQGEQNDLDRKQGYIRLATDNVVKIGVAALQSYTTYKTFGGK